LIAFGGVLILATRPRADTIRIAIINPPPISKKY
jgi:hypothetical protein